MTFFGKENIDVVLGDITQMEVDALVNAANNALMGGGGVDGAIHRAGGPAILEDCKRIVQERGALPTGSAVATTAGALNARMVIHTVGAVWRGGDQQKDQLLEQAYLNSLEEARKQGARSVAFPNISTGVYGFPRQRAASIAIRSCRQYRAMYHQPERIIFVCFDEDNASIYRRLLRDHSA